jgi:hypothetical protein
MILVRRFQRWRLTRGHHGWPDLARPVPPICPVLLCGQRPLNQLNDSYTFEARKMEAAFIALGVGFAARY